MSAALATNSDVGRACNWAGAIVESGMFDNHWVILSSRLSATSHSFPARAYDPRFDAIPTRMYAGFSKTTAFKIKRASGGLGISSAQHDEQQVNHQ